MSFWFHHPLVLLGVIATACGGGDLSAQQTAGRLGLGGFCPVSIIESQQWIKGNPEYQSTFDGKTYLFATTDNVEMFRANAPKYVPVLGGDCVVSAAKLNTRVAGSVQHAALYKSRVYLFPDRARKDEFLTDPPAFTDVDLAYQGNCAVSLIDLLEDVAGKPEYTVLLEGLRYQFPGEKQLSAFVKNPTKYKVKFADQRPPALSTSRSTPVSDQEKVSIAGISGCAGCDHGVKPIRSPDTLGLAVSSANGKVYVIEDAHQLYPDVYDRRFDGLKLDVTGHVLKREDQFVWLAPVSLVETK